jgi:hypothetical protein
MSTFSALAAIYINEIPNIVEEYSKIIEGYRRPFKKTIVKAADKKTRMRVQALRAQRPDIFVTGYPSVCQREKQPYIVPNDEIENTIREMGGDPHKAMFFEGDWYVCEPRDADEKKGPLHLWPGLQPNPNSNKDKFPYRPCCFVVDQYKKGGLLHKYLNETDPSKSNVITADTTSIDYVLTADKKLEPGKFADMPYNWRKIFKMIGLDQIQKTKKSFYPIVRYCVSTLPDSMFHCLERAFNPKKYLKNPVDRVIKIRNILAGPSGDIARAKGIQSTIGVDLVQTLKDTKAIIDPRIWVDILAEWYQCNIYIYSVSETDVNGDIVIPRSSVVYIPSEQIYDVSVILLLYYSELPEIFTVDIAVQLQLEDNKLKSIKLTFDDNDSKKIRKIPVTARKLFLDANKVFEVRN